jgi:uncharacterized protein YfaP (DUF2135 family)
MLTRFEKNSLRLIIFLILAFVMSGGILAQDESNHTLTPDLPVDGVINDDNLAQVYTFSATAGDTITLLLSGQEDVPLALLLTDSLGNNLGQVSGSAESIDVSLEDILIEESGAYYVTIFPLPNDAGLTEGSFVLILTVTETSDAVAIEPSGAPVTFQPGQVVLSNGIQVSLTWDTRDDLNLQVRDPVGGTLFWDSRFTDDGGAFGPDVNGLCGTLTEPPAVETATWPGGALATGSYEILVYYRQACEGANAVDFTVDVTVDGVALDPITSSIIPPFSSGDPNVYISSFYVNPDGTATIGESGPYTDTRVLDVPAQDLINAATTPLVKDVPIEGLITNQQAYQSYQYEGLAGEIVSISLNAIDGNLDTLLLVLDSSGNIIGSNDDVQVALNTNSQIGSLRLPADDLFIIVATRYGKLIGGTEGNFELVVSGSNVPVSLLNLNLPTGDIEITLTWDTNADLQLLVRDPSGNSVYDDTPRVPSGGQLTATGNINCSVSENLPVSYIYWPDGFLRIGSYEVEIWFQSECNDTRPVTAELFVVVEGELIFTDTISPQFNERYVTSFDINQSGIATPGLGGIIGGSETLNYQADLASALSISSGQTVPGSITPDAKFDVYLFEGQAGDVVTVDMVATSQTLDTLLFLIDPNGVEIARNDDANETTNSLISDILLTQDGEYVVVATHFGGIYGGTTGGYNLSLRIDR